MSEKIIEPINGSFGNVSKSILRGLKIKPKQALLSGILPIGGIEMQCAVLNDEMRVLTATSIFRAFGKQRRGMNLRLVKDGVQIPPFMASKNLEPYITSDFLDRAKTIEYQDGSYTKSGYDGAILVDMCEIYLQARRDNALTSSQLPQAKRAEILLTSFAKVGLSALIDEATGYQKVRTNDALRILLSRYIAEGLQKWIKTFPDEFFKLLDKLYGNEETASKNRPQYYGRFVNKYIYDPIEHGYVKAKLDKLNITDEGKRKARFHQWLNAHGRDVLIRQIGKIEGLMSISNDINHFRCIVKHKETVSVAPYLFDEMNKLIGSE